MPWPWHGAMTPGSTWRMYWCQMLSCMRRSEEHTSELQSRLHLVCRLLLENNNHPHRLRFATMCVARMKSTNTSYLTTYFPYSQYARMIAMTDLWPTYTCALRTSWRRLTLH